jgi:hypothetical protein
MTRYTFEGYLRRYQIDVGWSPVDRNYWAEVWDVAGPGYEWVLLFSTERSGYCLTPTVRDLQADIAPWGCIPDRIARRLEVDGTPEAAPGVPRIPMKRR